MSKVLISVTVLTVFLSLASFGQGMGNGTWWVTVGPEAGIPTGDFNNASSFGIGGTARLEYMVDPNFTVSAKSGYLHFTGKDINYYDASTATTYTISTAVNAIPILVGGKYFFMPTGDARVYGAADVGLYSESYSASANVPSGGSTVNVSASTSKTDFSAAPILGVVFKAGDKMNVDASASYTNVFTTGSTTSWIGFNVSLEFGLN